MKRTAFLLLAFTILAISAAVDDRPSTADCTWKYFNQTLDHFNPGVTVGNGATFQQRYCFNDQHWTKHGPIFFYTGNESPVEAYINNTGLMWELAPKFGALIVFAEHRYEGESIPEQKGVPDCLSYCTSEQALADYAVLIDAIKTEYSAESSPVIAFGGSYGGMLSSWLRFKYPSAVDGAIAASAPIWGFAKTTSPVGLDGAGVAISRGVSADGGATDTCRDNLRFSWPLIHAIGSTAAGRDLLTSTFRLCHPLKSTADVDALIAWGNAPWFNLAEGNYPFPSTYITFAVGPGLYPLPAWPMKVACKALNTDFKLQASGDTANVNFTLKMGPLSLNIDWDQVSHPSFTEQQIRESGALELLAGVREAVAVWYNVTGAETCFDSGAIPTSAANNNNNNININVRPASMLQHPGSFGHQNNNNKLSFGRAAAAAASSSSSSNVCTASQKGSWGPICCNDNLNLINYVVMGAGRDIFWPPTVPRGTTIEDIVNRPGTHTSCEAGYAAQGLFGVPSEADPWSSWMTTYYGGRKMKSHSNVVFSNGLMDPWSSAGVYGKDGQGSHMPAVQNVTADGSIVSVQIALGGHHADLFFTTPEDPACITEAREVEEYFIQKWIKEAQE